MTQCAANYFSLVVRRLFVCVCDCKAKFNYGKESTGVLY